MKNADVQKNYALSRQAKDSCEPEAAYDDAMKPFSALNSIENDHPLPLIYYHRSYAQRAMEPPENAKHALERAAQLAPFDKSLWFQVALMQAQEGKVRMAGQTLLPLANDPHGGRGAERAERFMKALRIMEEGKPVRSADLAVALSAPVVPKTATDAERSEPEGD